VQVASVTRQREIVEIIRTAMLFSNNMLDVVSEFAVLLKKAAIFAAKSRSTPDQLSNACVHPLFWAGVQLLAGLEFQNRNEVSRVHQRLVFAPLVFSKCSFVGCVRQLVNALANLISELHGHQAACGFGIETTAQ
jgi:hypothetical protein